MKMHKYWAHGQKLRRVIKSSSASHPGAPRKLKLASDTKEVNDGESECNVDTQDGFMCTDCGKLFKRKFTLTRHGEVVQNCTYCDQKFCTNRLLQKHYTLKHLTIVCKDCKETFARKISLEEHLRNRQTVSCDQCSQSFCYQLRLLGHKKKTHTSITCEECD
jgi:hypothetical protein